MGAMSSSNKKSDRHDALKGQFFHEQIQEIGLHQVQRRASDQHFSLERRAARLTQAAIFWNGAAESHVR